MAEHKDRRARGSGTGSRASRPAVIIIAVILVLVFVGWMVGWFADEEVLVETDQPAALEGGEAVVAPEVGAGEPLPEEVELEGAVEPDSEIGEEAILEEDEGLLEGETATGEEGVLEGAIDLGTADDEGTAEDDLGAEAPIAAEPE